MTDAPAYFSAGDLRGYATDIFLAHGLSADDAMLVADCLVQANLRGVDSHGVSRIPVYAERLRRKLVEPRPDIRIERVATAAASVDGGGGMGFVVGTRAMAEAMAIATEHGVGLASTRRSTHFGAAATYVLQAIGRKFMSLVFTNASPAMPVWGGRAPFLGSSPFAAGAPGGKMGPFVLDMATTVTARGKLRLAGQRGEPIAEGLALDADGRPTTDGTKAAEGGVVLPFGGVKGAGLSMLMEIFGGLFSGAAFAGEVANLFQDFSKPQNVGHFFLAIRPDLFMSMDAFEDRMDTLVERAKACPRAEGFDEILMPGEPESRMYERRSKTGIPVSPDVVSALEAEAEAVGGSMPAAADAPLGEAV